MIPDTHPRNSRESSFSSRNLLRRSNPNLCLTKFLKFPKAGKPKNSRPPSAKSENAIAVNITCKYCTFIDNNQAATKYGSNKQGTNIAKVYTIPKITPLIYIFLVFYGAIKVQV